MPTCFEADGASLCVSTHKEVPLLSVSFTRRKVEYRRAA